MAGNHLALVCVSVSILLNKIGIMGDNRYQPLSPLWFIHSSRVRLRDWYRLPRNSIVRLERRQAEIKITFRFSLRLLLAGINQEEILRCVHHYVKRLFMQSYHMPFKMFLQTSLFSGCSQHRGRPIQQHIHMTTFFCNSRAGMVHKVIAKIS